MIVRRQKSGVRDEPGEWLLGSGGGMGLCSIFEGDVLRPASVCPFTDTDDVTKTS